MPTSVIPNSEIFSFTVGGNKLELHGNLQQLQSTDEQDIATQRIIKRDGALQEGMGWRDRKFVATLCYLGPNARADVTALHAAIRVNSEGQLNHPTYGSVPARCQKFDETIDVVQASNVITVTLRLVEAGLDASVQSAAAQGVPAKAQAVTDATANLQVYAALFKTAAVAIATLITDALNYSTSTLGAVQTGSAAPALSSLLDLARSDAEATDAAVQADPAAAVDVDRFDALTAVNAVYSACLDLSDALAAARPPARLFTVPAPVSVLLLAAQFYGKDGLSRVDEILLANPQVATPHLIPAGTVLTMASPTV